MEKIKNNIYVILAWLVTTIISAIALSISCKSLESSNNQIKNECRKELQGLLNLVHENLFEASVQLSITSLKIRRENRLSDSHDKYLTNLRLLGVNSAHVSRVAEGKSNSCVKFAKSLSRLKKEHIRLTMDEISTYTDDNIVNLMKVIESQKPLEYCCQ